MARFAASSVTPLPSSPPPLPPSNNTHTLYGHARTPRKLRKRPPKSWMETQALQKLAEDDDAEHAAGSS